jgi:hypothetical protein
MVLLLGELACGPETGFEEVWAGPGSAEPRKRTSGQIPEPASGVSRSSTADESHAEPHAPITAG